jgi:hypothetical protein
MLNISALNTVIAVVIVLLVLSLIVQSIQSLVKKIFKMKSSVFVNSIIDLFQYVDSKELLGKEPQVLVDLVKEEFRKLGRETLFGRPMFDSISKKDLLKIVDKIVQTHPDLKGKVDPAKVQEELKKWFETVMQGFNERYTRHMKTVGVVIAFLVVVVLNANIFTVFRNIATSDALQAQILSMSDQVRKQAADAKKEQANANTTGTSATATTKPTSRSAAGSSKPNAPPSPTPTASPAAQSDQQAEADAKQNAKQIQDYVNEYKGFGFTPLKPKQVSDFVWGQGAWQNTTFTMRSAHGAKVLLGWLIMTLLLSVGAPFWQDALESLFGLKGLIRKKGETQNVEQGEGGQDKP